LEYIRKDSLKPLVIYVTESFSDQLAKFEHFGSIQAFKLKYHQYLESAETKLTASVPDMIKKAEGRGLEKEEEDYFNEDSDEEDSIKRTKHAQNEESKAKVANGVESDDISSRPKSGGLVDYADDDDEDFNPPPKEPNGPAEDDELLKISTVKRKLVNAGDGKHADGEVRKRQKIETRITCAKISALTSLASKHKDSLASSSPSCEANGVLGEYATHSDEHEHSTGTAETSRQVGGDCLKAMGSLSGEKSVNATKTNDSEPYSVR
jgi:protein phosphatase-4 regulatory subunit 3